MIETSRTRTDVSALLVSLQLSDSAFPSGFYTMSHGLEAFRQAGLTASEDVGDLLENLLIHSVGPGDATALARAHDAAAAQHWDEVERVDRILFASKLNRELRTASVRSGRQLIGIAAETFDSAAITPYASRVATRDVPGCQPVVAAVCYAATGVDASHAVVSDLYAFCASFVGAALRLRLTDHRAAQALLRQAAPTIEVVADAAVRRPLEDVGGFAPMSDICSAHHERAEARLFTT